MNRLFLIGCAVAIAQASHSTVFAQTDSTREVSQPDNLIIRLKNSKHVGLRADETLSAYFLYLYTPKQREENLASFAAYREKSKAFDARMEAVDAKRRLSQEQRESSDQLKALDLERFRLQSERPEPPIARDIKFYDVVHFGDDYMEIRQSETPGDIVLIPLSKICKVILKQTVNSSRTGEASDEPKTQ